MFRAKSGLLPVLALAALVTAVAATAHSSAEPTKIFEIGNIAAVYNAPTAASIFTTTRDWTVVEVWTYHWNDAKGSTATGTVGLKDLKTGKLYGPWKTVGSPGQGGVPNAYWHTTTKVLLPAGRYRIVDSSPSTWSQNEESGGRGMGWVMAIPAAGLAWPALPDALVSIESVSNGCGGGTASSAAADRRHLDVPELEQPARHALHGQLPRRVQHPRRRLLRRQGEGRPQRRHRGPLHLEPEQRRRQVPRRHASALRRPDPRRRLRSRSPTARDAAARRRSARRPATTSSRPRARSSGATGRASRGPGSARRTSPTRRDSRSPRTSGTSRGRGASARVMTSSRGSSAAR